MPYSYIPARLHCALASPPAACFLSVAILWVAVAGLDCAQAPETKARRSEAAQMGMNRSLMTFPFLAFHRPGEPPVQDEKRLN